MVAPDEPRAQVPWDRSALAEFLGREVRSARRLSGGASRETYLLELAGLAGQVGPEGLEGQECILQRTRPGPVASAFSMVAEADLLRAAAAASVPVPRVLAASDDPAVLGAPFVVVERLPGETIARRILRDKRFSSARGRLLGQAAGALAAVHRIDPAAVPSLRADDPVGSLRRLLDGLVPTMGPSPAFEIGLRWLELNRPPSTPPCVVHGDFRLGNLLVDEAGLVAVLDWELAHLGDPVEDLGWFSGPAWRFGGPGEVAGLGSLDELVEAYRDAGGGSVPPERLRWWRVAGCVRWGVICMLQAATHLSGASRSVELAAIGRRVVESEHDLLVLVAEAEGEPPPEGPDLRDGRLRDGWVLDGGASVGRATSLGRPTAQELVVAVEEYLRTDVVDAEGLSGRVAFHARVAANALGVAVREMALGARATAAHRDRLDELGVVDDDALAAAVRSGALDDRGPLVRRLVGRSVADALAIANPGYRTW